MLSLFEFLRGKNKHKMSIVSEVKKKKNDAFAQKIYLRLNPISHTGLP